MEYNAAVQRHFAAPALARELPRGKPGLVAGEAEDRALHVWIKFELQIADGAVAAAGFRRERQAVSTIPLPLVWPRAPARLIGLLMSVLVAATSVMPTVLGYQLIVSARRN